ncbi:MAG: HDIG domain-containing protein [Firmicutes bacterium]|jgi:putative nucleotidyltransferase with HDIG domain|nr:HDIG domain-containing protein [Bacillota bacterium]HPU01543.1 HDIG domain-containing protein [Bacillota bacterium]
MKLSSRIKVIEGYFPSKWDERTQRLVLAAVIFVVFYLVLVLASMPARIYVELGRPSPKTIYAPREVVDEYTTEQLRRAAAEAVPEVFDYKPEVETEAVASIEDFFDRVTEIRDDADSSTDEKVNAIKELLGEEIPVSSVRALLGEKSIIEELESRLISLLKEVFQQGIKVNGVETARRQVNREIALFPFSPELKQVAEALARPLLKPNMIANHAATERNREAARKAVVPVIIQRNTLIISEGELVTEKHIAQLESLGLLRGKHADYPGMMGLFVLLAIVFVLVSIYLYKYVHNVYTNPKMLLLLGLVAILNLLAIVLAAYFSGYLIPVAMGVILITVIFGYHLAVLMTLVFALLVGFVTGGELSYVPVALTGGLAAVYAVSRVNQRGDLAKAGLYVAGANMATILAQFLFWGNFSLESGVIKELGYALAAGGGSGLLSSIIAIGVLPYLESAFGVTTSITLLELSNPNHPLLRQLQTKAPGTYYHSMMVCNLAEAAAEAVNADPLLTRIGAYYHDIGKLKRPYFFAENQLSGQNPHDRLSPNLSAMIIRLHVKDGVELARKYRLPAVIEDIIRQHHGTSLIYYFYQKALESCSEEDQVSEEKFSYEGPLPQTKEAAIIMLADSIEAGVRALSNPVSSRVEALIRRIIKEKLNSGQMDECDLTLKELDRIGDAFVRIMAGIYHARVEYPEKDLRAELERNVAR